MKFLKPLMFVVLLFFIVPVTVTDCSGGTVTPKAVCDIGVVVCDLSEVLFDSVPDIPPDIVTYVNLACVNLEILCSAVPESAEYQTAKENLKLININLSYAVEHYKSTLQPIQTE